MKTITAFSLIALIAACGASQTGGIHNTDIPAATQGTLGTANVACVERDGILVGKRGGGVICKLPNGEIIDQMTFL